MSSRFITVEEVNTYINQLFYEIGNNDVSIKTVDIAVDGALLTGGYWDIITSKTNSNYGYQIASSYIGEIKYRMNYGGTWRNFNNFILTSDLDVVSFSQEITADTATALNSAPHNKQYIPVVTSVSGTPRYTGSFCFTSGSWHFTTNNTQTYGFAFYKYPA